MLTKIIHKRIYFRIMKRLIKIRFYYFEYNAEEFVDECTFAQITLYLYFNSDSSQFFFWIFFLFFQKLKISLTFGPVFWLVHTCSSQFSINCEVKLISPLTWNNSSHKVWNHFFPVVAVFQRAALEFVFLCIELQIKTTILSIRHSTGRFGRWVMPAEQLLHNHISRKF